MGAAKGLQIDEICMRSFQLASRQNNNKHKNYFKPFNSVCHSKSSPSETLWVMCNLCRCRFLFFGSSVFDFFFFFLLMLLFPLYFTGSRTALIASFALKKEPFRRRRNTACVDVDWWQQTSWHATQLKTNLGPSFDLPPRPPSIIDIKDRHPVP